MFQEMTSNERRMIIILTSLNFLNFMDRQVVYPLFSHIQAEFGLSDTQLGMIAMVFLVVFSISTIPLGLLADRFSRKVIIASGVFLWSLMTMLSGVARGFKSLLTFRGLVGVGEASYAPASTAMIADNYSHKLRARVQGLFYTGSFLGGTVGAMIGGMIVYYTDSWRLAFFIVAIPGFILALYSLTLKDRRDHHDDEVKGAPVLKSIRILYDNAAYKWLVFSGMLQAFAAGSYVTWGVEYINRYTAYNLRDASIGLGLTMLTAGLCGIFLGSHIADKWQEKTPAGRSWLTSLASIICVPFLLLGFWVDGTGFLFFGFFFIGIMMFSFYFGPVAATLHDITAPKLRATAFAGYIFIVHLLGQATGPVFVGWISDQAGLKMGMILVTIVLLAGGIAFVPVATLIEKRQTPLYE